MSDTNFQHDPNDQTLGTFSLSDLWDSVYRRKYIIIALTLCMLGIAYLYTETTTPKYYAEAKISLENQEKTLDLEAVVTGVPLDASFISTEAEIITSRTLISSVVDILHPELAMSDDMDEDTLLRHNRRIGAILSKLRVSQLGKSRALAIGFESASPSYATNVANAVANVYIEQQIINRFDAINTTSDWLEERVRKLRTQVRESETRVNEYREREGIVDSRGIDIIEQDILDLSGELNKARAELLNAEAQLKQIENRNDLQNAPNVISSPIIVQLRAREAEAQNEIARLSQEFGPSHPDMEVARANLASVKSEISQQMEDIAGSLESTYEVAQENVRRMEQELDKLKADFNLYRTSNVELEDLEREAMANRELLEVLNARLKETEAQQGTSFQPPSARLISEATVPTSPSHPKKDLILAAAFIGGLGLAIAFAIGIDQFQTGAYNGKQLQSITNKTNISLVPKTKLDPGRGINRHADFPVKEPYAVYTESIRSISMFLRIQLSKEPEKNIINFTSCLGNEGKSSVISSLARQMALEGLRVLAIDCDMRKPRLGHTLGVSPEFGLHDVLKGTQKLQDVILQDEISGLDFVVAGKLQDVNIISREIGTWEKLITDAKKKYDIILLDSPPILFVADTKLIAKISENILCVQSRKTPLKLISYAVDMLQRLECPLLGTIITMADSQNKYLYEYEEAPKDEG